MNSNNRPTVNVAVLVDAWFPFIGGGQIHVRELTRHLKRDYRVNSLIFHPPHLHPITRLVWTLVAPFQIALAHHHHHFQLIHSHGFNSGLAAKLTSLLIGSPVIHTVHGSHLMDKGDQTLKALLEKWLLTGIAYSAQITVSRNFLDYPRKTKTCTHIPNGVNLEAFDQVKTRKSPTPTIIFVGRDHPDKGLDLLKQAHIKLSKTFPNLKLCLAIGNLRGKSLIKAYKSSHLFVLPSLAEGQPITLLEAWAARLPVVVTAVGDNPYMVKNKQTGLLVKPGSLPSLTHAIKYLLNNPRQANSMAQAGYKLIESHYTWEKVAQKTYDLYKKLLQ